MVGRLPDIPEDIWIADQQTEYERATRGMWDADIFDEQARQMIAAIPPDIEDPGMSWEEYQREEEERRRAEEARRIAAEEQARQLAEAQAHEQELQAAQEQKTLEDQIVAEASEQGIQSPGSFGDELMGLESRPMWTAPDHTSSAVLDSGVGEPAPRMVDPMSSRTDPGRTIETLDEFDVYTSELMNQIPTDEPAPQKSIWEQAGDAWSAITSAVASNQNEEEAVDIGGRPTGIPFAGEQVTLREGEGLEDFGLVKNTKETFDDVMAAINAEQTAIQARRDSGREFGIGDVFSAQSVSSEPFTPEEEAARSATTKATSAVLHTPLQVIEDVIDIARGDPTQQTRLKDPYGIMEQAGIKDGVTPGQIIANVTPLRILNAPQWIDVAAQMIEAPVETGIGLSALGALGSALKSPTWRPLGLAVIGGLAGGIDAYMNSRDWTGDQQTDLTDVAVEGGAAAVAAARSPKTLPTIPRLIKTIAEAPTTQDMLRYFDVLANKVVTDGIESMRMKFPAIADGLESDLAVGQRMGMSETPKLDVAPEVSERYPTREIQNPNAWDVFNPKSGRTLRTFDTEDEAARYVQRYANEGWDYAPADLDNPMRRDAQIKQMQSTIREREEAAQGFSEQVDTQITGRHLPAGAIAGMTGGSATGAVAGAASAPEDASMSERLDRAIKGAAIGGVGGTIVGGPAGIASALGAAKVFEHGLRSGRISLDLKSTHPDDQYRVATAMLLAARGKADDELVDIPATVGYHQKADPTGEYPFEPMTAGEIRERYGNFDVMRIGRTVRDMLSDWLVGSERGRVRQREAGADLAVIHGIERPRSDLNAEPRFEQLATPEELSKIEKGTLVQASAAPDGTYHDIWKEVNDITQEYGLKTPRVFVDTTNENINAAAWTGTANMPTLTFNVGALGRLDRDELRGMILHELSHATDDDLGRGLIQQAGDALNSLRGIHRATPELDRPRTGEGPLLRDDVEDPAEIPFEAWSRHLEEMRSDAPSAAGEMLSAQPGRTAPPSTIVAMDRGRGRVAPRVIEKGLFERAYNWWTSKMTDNWERLQGYQDAVARAYKQQTGQLLPAEHLVAELKRFDTSKAAAQVIDRNIKPAIRAFKELGFDDTIVSRDAQGNPVRARDRLDDYLAYTQYLDVAKHQGNYAQTGQMNTSRVFPGGLRAPEIEKWLQDFETNWMSKWTREERKKFADATQQVWEQNRQNLDLIRESGLIDDNAYQLMRKAYPRYVPTRILEHIRDSGMVGAGKSLSINSNTLHNLSYQGTDKEALSPLAGVVSATYQAHAAAQKNRVFNAFLGLWSEAEALRNVPGTEREAADLGRLVQPWQASHSTGNQWQPVEGFVNGQKIKLAVHADLGDVTKVDSPIVIPILSGLMAMFRATATSRNPVFLTSNAALDFVNYMIRESARDQGLHLTRGTVPTGAAGGVAGAAVGAATAPEDATPEERAARAAIGAGTGMTAGLAAGSSRPLHMYGEMLGKMLWDSARGDIARHEYRGDFGRFYEQGGGYSGISPMTGYKERGAFDPLSNNKFEAKIGQLLERAGWGPASEAEQEVERLGRGLFPVRVNTKNGWMNAIELGSARDITRFLTDVVTLKPVEALGERIEMVPRVAAMKNAEQRALPAIDALKAERADLVAGRLNPQSNRINPAMVRTPAARSAAYKQAIADIDAEIKDAELRSKIESTQAGRTVTIDFNKGGSWAKNINSFIPFFNVGMQALADPARAMKENGSGYLMTALAATVAPIMIAEVLNNRDKQTRTDYDDVPQHYKDSGAVIMLPGEAPVDEHGNRHPQFAHIPYRQLAPLAILTREVMQRTMFPSDQDERTGSELGAALLDSMSPIQATGMRDLTVSAATPVLGAGIQLAFNRDTFRDRAIISKAADERASPLSKALAKKFGFNDETIRPAFWEFATRELLTGYAGMAHGASQILYGEEAPTPQNVPVAGGLYGRWVKGGIGEEADRAREHVLSDTSREILRNAGVLWTPQPATQEVNELTLTRLEYARYQKAINQAVDRAVQRAAASESWKNAGLPAEKQKILDRYLTSEREVARDRFYATIPEADRLKRKAEQRRKTREESEKAKQEQAR